MAARNANAANSGSVDGAEGVGSVFVMNGWRGMIVCFKKQDTQKVNRGTTKTNGTYGKHGTYGKDGNCVRSV